MLHLIDLAIDLAELFYQLYSIYPDATRSVLAGIVLRLTWKGVVFWRTASKTPSPPDASSGGGEVV